MLIHREIAFSLPSASLRKQFYKGFKIIGVLIDTRVAACALKSVMPL